MSPGSLLDPEIADSTVDAARRAAERAAARAGVRIEMPHELDDLARAAEVWRQVWSPEGEPPVSGEMLRALTHAGNYLSVALLDGRVAGALMGFFGGNGRVDVLHSHILGVDAASRGRGVGHALKLHQRAWTLQRGIARMTWTYDPLVRRNGHFNLVKLGARGVEYLVDFYGAMPDAINGGDHSDRILVSWDLAATATADASSAESVDAWLLRGAAVALESDAYARPVLRDAGDAATVLCATPADIVDLRRTDPACAHQWRTALRTAVHGAVERGLVLSTMARSGWYVLTREEG